MIKQATRWAVAPWSDKNEYEALALAEQIAMPPLITKLLVQRGITEASSAIQFLTGGTEFMHDPYLMLGMKEAVARIRLAGANGEKIRIYGDYDADGVSSTSLLIYLFKELGYSYDYYIPHREKEGYGLNQSAIERAVAEGISLIVTVDTGISANEEIQYATELGLDVVVTDHHEPPEQLPICTAVVNPKQPGCQYPFKGLAGVGVAFKLAHALLERPPIEWADIVCLGTIADLMPLTDENRILVQLGLKQLKKIENVGFKALCQVAGIEQDSITATNVAFGLAPRINAAGRLDHASKAVELITKGHYDDAIHIAVMLDTLNQERQKIVENIVKEAEKMWEAKRSAAAKAGASEPSVIVLAGKGWNVGVIGIVASKLLEKHYKPVVILGIDSKTGYAKGSARSISGFDLHAALTRCEDLMDHYGGHEAAAGMSLHREQIAELEARLSQLAEEWLTEEDWIRKTSIDLICDVNDATLDIIEQLSFLEPFGQGNLAPRLLFRNVKLAESRTIGKEARHLKLLLGGIAGVKGLDAVGFGIGEYAAKLKNDAYIDIVGELSINEWNGGRKPQLHIHDMSYEPTPPSFPEREQFGRVYQSLKQFGHMSTSNLAGQLTKMTGQPPSIIIMMLNVFEELGFIKRNEQRQMVIVPTPVKRDLYESESYRHAKSEMEAAQLAYAAARER